MDDHVRFSVTTRGDRRSRVPGRAGGGNKWARGGVCMRGAARSNCHTLALSNLAAGRGKTASMAATRINCILRARDLGMLVLCVFIALVFGLCRWSANCWRLLVVYFRIAQIPRLNLSCAGPL
jgi:hypothetical protein